MRFSLAVATVAVTIGLAPAQQKIYWADDVLAGWQGKWPQELQTVPERTA